MQPIQDHDVVLRLSGCVLTRALDEIHDKEGLGEQVGGGVVGQHARHRVSRGMKPLHRPHFVGAVATEQAPLFDANDDGTSIGGVPRGVRRLELGSVHGAGLSERHPLQACDALRSRQLEGRRQVRLQGTSLALADHSGLLHVRNEGSQQGRARRQLRFELPLEQRMQSGAQLLCQGARIALPRHQQPGCHLIGRVRLEGSRELGAPRSLDAGPQGLDRLGELAAPLRRSLRIGKQREGVLERGGHELSAVATPVARELRDDLRIEGRLRRSEGWSRRSV